MPNDEMKTGEGGAGGAPGSGIIGPSFSAKTLVFHEKIYVAYVYDMSGMLLRWKMFTHDVDAAAWARKKADKLARRQPREILPGLGMAPPTELPWSVRVYTNGGGTTES